jgi:hypothetical protein
MLNRGRIQAQGENLEQSESWAQDLPLTEPEGMELLEKLKNKIPKKELEIRKDAFVKAQKFIEQAAINNGVDAPANVTFRAKGYNKERVDIEVKTGKAFVPENKD